MDVDLLRPGTVPIAPDTVLWFEFLLHKDLLLRHLQKPHSDPGPVDLITKFYDAISETLRNRSATESGEIQVDIIPPQETTLTVKSIALKILSLKVAAYLKWDLGQLRCLPFKTQIDLLQDLLFFTNNKTIAEIPNIVVENVDEILPPYVFALVIYHRWLLNVTMYRVTSNWQIRIATCEVSPSEESIICSQENVDRTIDFLRESLTWEKIPSMLTFECFKLPSEENNLNFYWDLGVDISKHEYLAQINYDLGTFFFYKEDYELAKQHFNDCSASFKKITNNIGFANFNPDVLDVYVRACCGPSETSKGSLLEQLNLAIFNHYMGVTNVLQQDNISREIPLVHRINLELDIEGAISSGAFTVARDLLFQIRALNFIRCALDKKPVNHQYLINGPKQMETLLWAIELSWKSFPDPDKKLIKGSLMNLILTQDVSTTLQYLQSHSTLSDLFEQSEIKYMLNSDVASISTIPPNLDSRSWNVYDCGKNRKPKLEIKQLEQNLLTTYDHKEIREILSKLCANQLATSAWNINPKWELPIPLQSVLKSLPRGFLQDFGLVMLSKAREQLGNGDWNSALELMLILDKELSSSNGGATTKLSRLISWEILLVQITQLLEEWPKSTIDKVALANACEVCLQANESVLPRTEVTQHCVLCLMNLGRWEFLTNFDKRWPSFEIVSSLAIACDELVKHKDAKKLDKNLWEIVLPIFNFAPFQSKRGNSGGAPYYDSQISNLRSNIMFIFSKIRNSVVFAVIISMLARMHNVLKDESSLELQVEYSVLWPAVISNANSYSTKTVCEVLFQIVDQGLKYYPTNISWLRLRGDINFANGNNNSAMKDYLKSLLVYNDYFNIPVHPDDHIFRRMIRCCMASGCHTQAAVLCQFLEDPDYVLAFRILNEQKYSNDAVDAYYHCIWDVNILEFLIHTHNKRGEFQRRKCATQVMGLLELNTNNNEEIQREASNLRKSTFLRALCKQYVV